MGVRLGVVAVGQGRLGGVDDGVEMRECGMWVVVAESPAEVYRFTDLDSVESSTWILH